MRTSTVFIVFGAVLLVFIVSALISDNIQQNEPYMQATYQFFEAVRGGDPNAVQAIVDPATAQVIHSNGKLTGIRFSNISAFQGVFSTSPTLFLPTNILISQQVNDKAKPLVDPEGKMVTVPLRRYNKVYLHEVNGKWVVFYMTAPGTDYKAPEGSAAPPPPPGIGQ